MDPKIVIVTVNYRTADLLIAAVQSIDLQRLQFPNISMLIVDNDSADGSLEKLQKHVKEKQLSWVEILESSDNRGYAAGNNLALNRIRASGLHPDYVWLLNPDTVLRDGATGELIRFLQEHNDVSMAGSRLEDEDGTAQVSSFNFPGVWSELSSGARLGILDRLLKKWLVARPISDVPERCDWVAGASMMMKWKVIEDIGLMDDDYFLYFEELDYCLKANGGGHACWYVPASRVCHAVGASTGISDTRKAAPRRPKYWFDSRRRYFLKNFGYLKLILADIAHISGYCTWRLRNLFAAKSKLAKEPPHYLKDFIRNSFLFRGFNQNTKPGLFIQIKSDLRAHENDWTRPGFRALAFYRFGNWRMTIKPRLIRAPLSVFYRILYRRARNIYGIELPYTAQVGQNVIFEHQHGIVVHGNASIGDNTIVRQGVTMGIRYLHDLEGAPTIGQNVNIGAGAQILGRVKVGDNVTIGANAVVLNDIPDGETVVGIPAKPIQKSSKRLKYVS